MDKYLQNAMREIHSLVDEYRAQCLWYLRKDYYPDSVDSALRVLQAIENHGDVTAFKKAATLRQWLSQHSNAPSAI
jgi:hypothetical protein